MTRNVLLTYILLLSATWGIQAQVSDGSKAVIESRLNVGTKKKTPSSRELNQKAFSMEYKPITYQKTLALRSYYRTLLFANSYPEEAAAETTAVAALPASERRVVTSEDKVLSNSAKMFSNEQITVSNIYPHPASERATIDYSISGSIRDAKISIYNILGASVSDHPLDKNENKLEIFTKDMPSGVYFYQLAVDGKKVATKKLMVRHQQ